MMHAYNNDSYGIRFGLTLIFLVLLAMNAWAFDDNFDRSNGDPGTDWTWEDADGASGTSGAIDNNRLKISARGRDLWEGEWYSWDYDEYAAYYIDDVDGDFTAIVQVVSQGNTNGWAKCGIMVKDDISAQGADDAGYVILAVTPGNGVAFQYDGNNEGHLESNTNTSPSGFSPPNAWLKLTKSGTEFKAYYSTDASTWALLTTRTMSTANTIQDVGLFVCSHNSWSSSTVEFDNFSLVNDASTLYTYYSDSDGDGYGDALNTTSVASETAPAGYTTDDQDCNDSDATINPAGTEVCDNVDNDCDGSIDEGVGENTYYYDADGDGYGVNTYTQFGCSVPDGFSELSGDCNDSNSDIHPGEYDICGDDIDQDCSGTDRVCGSSEICLEIADVPLSTVLQGAPPMIMFLLDDSGSMAWDLLCPENNGQFERASWVSDKKPYWKSQYSGYNGIYYNPAATYTPWPNYSNASTANPKTHPLGNTTVAMSTTFTYLDGVSIKWPHWYVWSELGGSPYLVVLDGSALYYKVTNRTPGDHGIVRELLPTSPPPADVAITRSYDDEIQNFTNWFTYYRTRELVAKAALGKVIENVSGVKVGIHTINKSVIQTVQPIGVDGETDYRDSTLTNLYNVGKTGGTPLRVGLEDVGQYFHATDGNNGNIGDSPYATEDDGGSCQQAYVIVMTDGYYNGTTNPSVGNADGNDDTAYDGDPFKDDYSNTLADVAMYYYENDLSTLPNNLVTTDVDKAAHQHMVTYTVSFGLTGTLTPTDACPSSPEACPDWPEPNTDDKKIDDLWHAAVNGRGEYLSARDTQELIDSLSDVIMAIQKREKNGAAVSLNTQKLESDTDLYLGLFDSSDWHGDLQAYDVNATTGNVETDYSWSAKTVFESMSWTNRQILTFNGRSCVPFTDSGLTDAQKNLLDPDEATYLKLLNYIRGDSSNEAQYEGGIFRNRSSMLGDIVNSSPKYDNGVVYVGANDGMLHAFNAETGAEIFGYVPSRVIENLRLYADTSYTHKYFVDGPISIGGTSENRWLVGGLGKGGRGVYGINISNATAISESNRPTVWEYPASDDENDEDADMGFTFSSASIVKANNGDLVAIFGNGYDSPNGHAVLYIAKIDGSEVTKIDTGVGNGTDLCNGLSTPTCVDTNFDGKVDYVFAGDLLGNMWKFDLTSDEKTGWDVFFKDNTDVNQPLFQAMDADGNTQPITGSADVMFHCDKSLGGMMVVFGTGKFNSHGDISNYQSQSIYGIWDWSASWAKNGVTPTEKYLGSLLAPTDGVRHLSNQPTLSLLQQTKSTLDETTGTRITSSSTIDWFRTDAFTALEAAGNTASYNKGTHVGWYIDLPLDRERVISKTQIREGIAIVVSIIPSDEPCTAGGKSIVQLLNVCDGSAVDDDDDDDDEKEKDKLLDDIYYEPAILEDKMYFSPEEVHEISPETIGLHYWRMFDR